MWFSKVITPLVVVLLVVLIAGRAEAQSQIQLNSVAEVEKASLTPDGRKALQRGPADSVIPGQEVIFTTTYENTGGKAAENAVITNPIPEQMVYKAGSVRGEGARITFSADGGRTFNAPTQLFIKDAAGRVFPARPQDYTHIRWTFDNPLPPGARGEVSFRAILK